MQLLNRQEKASPNLLSPHTGSGRSIEIKISEFLVKADKILLFTAEALLVGLILYSIKLSNDLSSLERTIKSKASELNQAEDVETEIRKIKSKLGAFERIATQNPKIQDKIELVYSKTPQDITIRALTYENNKLNLTLNTQRSEFFAKMVSSYLESKKVSQVSLIGATLISDRDEYIFQVEVEMVDTKDSK